MIDSSIEALVHEIEAVKKLLVLQSLASGYKQKDIAATLGISEATLSRMLPKSLGKSAARRQHSGNK